MTSRISPRTGKTRKRSARPRLSLTDRLANLHLLLRAKSFARWPLSLTFFAEDVYRVWQKWVERTPGALRPGITVAMDETMRTSSTAVLGGDQTLLAKAIGINAINLGYSNSKSQLEKARAVFRKDNKANCGVCHQPTPAAGAATLLCTNAACSAVAHLQCLSQSFLQAEKADADTLVPTSGTCLSCGTELQWINLVKDLSLRMRGEKQITAIFKPKRGKKATTTAAASVEDSEPFSEEDDPLEMVFEDEEDEWQELPESSDVEVDAITKYDTIPGHRASAFTPSEPVIEESDWDDAELLTPTEDVKNP